MKKKCYVILKSHWEIDGPVAVYASKDDGERARKRLERKKDGYSYWLEEVAYFPRKRATTRK